MRSLTSFSPTGRTDTMQQPMQPILQHLFQVSSLEDVSRQRLEAFVGEHPSFGLAHYLLSRKLKAENSEGFAAVTQKTSLYFANPFWLQWQLDNVALEGGHAPWVAAAPVFEEPTPVAEEPMAGDDLAEALSETQPEVLTLGEEQIMTAGEGEAPEGEPALVAQTEAQTEAEPSAAERLLLSIEEARGLRESLHKINDDFTAETAVAGETLPPEVETPPALVDAPVMEPIRDEKPPVVLEGQQAPAPPPREAPARHPP